MSLGLRGRRMDYGYALVTLNGSGAGTANVTFTETAFVDAPHVVCIPGRADAGTRTAGTITKTGFTITVTGSDLLSQDVEVFWISHEKT